MKRLTRPISMLGVTLLEIMLVLAIAAMIIVMSVRYYQSASASQQANAALQQIQAIAAIADGLAQGAGSFTAVSQGAVEKLMPNQIMTAPWGGDIKITTSTPTSYTVSFAKPPAGVCAQLQPKLAPNKNFTAFSCDTTALTYTYLSQ